ncbi:DNA polymerase III subunit delta' [Limosilactobacillus sp. STM2_1]|uniref:DNA polymerase III subunit delta n=1 Tax=Limosilactobacillus rudii TaxID=2759755 RepID=A0A7W3YNQ6_9LACO|nr:DNA polymerase III subunit delta' [Limosilactobacillus rudii]MBB1080392.1 DNA polymerase III subunit delta' [Limosilactobacillus rudii]MBB1098418.1 DNA polymerase III subunit delta' [Limosilactobacillus rudii]MCD7135426.1 DNA polymerase III subunit delta' [Limosilactobacillus rudii]
MAEQGLTRAERLQPTIITRFQKILANKELAHAYLLVGPGGSGKMSVARWLALRLFCLHPENNEPDLTCPECQRILSGNHPDIVYASPEGRQIKVDEIRHLKKEFTKSAVEGNKKLFIIQDADKMTNGAANSLLKFIEEPGAGVYILMLTANKSALLPTIRSRTQVIELPPLKKEALLKVLAEHDIPVAQRQIAVGITDSVSAIEQWQEDDWFGNTIMAVLQWYKDTAKGDMLGFVDVQTSLLKVATDRDKQQITLDLIALIWRDTLILASGITDPNRLHFNNALSEIREVASRYSVQQLLAASQLTLKTRHLLEQNISFQNVVEQLTIRLVQTLSAR